MTFESEMLRAQAMQPERPEYWAGYIRGLRCAHHGEAFGTPEEHCLWLSLVADDDEAKRLIGDVPAADPGAAVDLDGHEVRRAHGEVKAEGAAGERPHLALPHVRVAELLPERQEGFLQVALAHAAPPVR